MDIDQPIQRFLNTVIEKAVSANASDIHFEPYERALQIRYRSDGRFFDLEPAPKSLTPPIISRLKLLANLNIAETRKAQDGHIAMNVKDSEKHFRISTLPTQFGESVVLRVLDQSSVQLKLDALGMPTEILEAFRNLLSSPHGLIIVTGPTGSGKTTTLYSALKEIQDPSKKILTAEDPIEHNIEGVTQTSINTSAGLTFPKCLRAFLRHDPDIIMIGEIRDLETAQIAVRAALTGHLVLTTLHTNDAPSSITRLVDLGLEPHIIASTLRGVMAQRLVRKKEAGRLGLFELMTFNEEIRSLIANHSDLELIRQAAMKKGLIPLKEQANQAVAAELVSREAIDLHF